MTISLANVRAEGYGPMALIRLLHGGQPCRYHSFSVNFFAISAAPVDR
jgi:hypothetical protein